MLTILVKRLAKCLCSEPLPFELEPEIAAMELIPPLLIASSGIRNSKAPEEALILFLPQL